MERTLTKIFLWACRMECELKKKKVRFFIHTLELVMPLECFPYDSTGKLCICNVFRPRATRLGVAMHTYGRDDLYLIYNIESLLLCMELHL